MLNDRKYCLVDHTKVLFLIFQDGCELYIICMPHTVLLTKLHVPYLQPGLIHRIRLIEKLSKGMQGKLTLVSASAGFGKTTLISEWVTESQISAVWVSLDEEHNDLNCFLLYLVMAIQKKFMGIGHGAMAILSSMYGIHAESVLTALLNDIADQDQQLNFVLDDYHIIENDMVHDAVSFLLDNMPPQMHLLISSRNVPSLPLARLRARGQLVELSAEDLRFTTQESAEFFRNTMNIELSSENIEILSNRTEGWIAGLQLAALSLQKRDNIREVVDTFNGTHQYVLDYLVDEVLSCQPTHVRQFLEKTSILDRMCAPLCDAVIADESICGQTILETVERSNLFIVPLDNERKWFRYHHLFRDLLRKRLHDFDNNTVDAKKQRPRLHMNACIWYDENGFISDAFYHAVAAEDFETAADLAEKIWPKMEENYQHSTFIGLMKMLPGEQLGKHPVLCTGYGWSLLFTGKIEESECWIQKAEAWLNSANENSCSPANSTYSAEQLRELQSMLSFARVYKALSIGNLSETFMNLERAMQSPPTGKANRYAAFAMYATTMSLWRTGNLHNALNFVINMIDNLEKADNQIMAQNMILVNGLLLEITGDLNQAAHLYKNAIEGASKITGCAVPALSTLLLKSAIIYLEQGNLELAEQYIIKSESAGRKASISNWSYFWYITQAQFKVLRGDITDALDMLHNAQKYFVRTPLPDINPLSAQIARLWIKQGRLTEVKKWVDNQNLGIDDEMVYMREYGHITLARYLIAEYLHNDDSSYISGADKLLERLLQAAKDGGRITCVIEILILQAISLNAQNRQPAALEKLRQAIQTGQPQHFARVFINEGAPMVELLLKVKASGIVSCYIKEILAFFDKCKPDGYLRDSVHTPSNTATNNQLSKRELEVLKLVEKGFSNIQISEKLFISLSTVKGHNLKIFEKLNVKSRTEALVRAREINLL